MKRCFSDRKSKMCTTEIGAGTFLFVNTNDLNVHIGEMYSKLKDDKKNLWRCR